MVGRDALRGFVAGGAAIAVIFAGVSPTLPPTPELAGVTYGVGGSGDGFGITIPWNFNGTIVPQGDTYQSIVYPAALGSDIPLISDLPWLSELPYWPETGDRSASIGRAKLTAALSTVPAGQRTTVIGMSQGAQIVDQIRVTLTKDQNSPDYRFILLGNPIRPDGGVYTRFPWLGQVPMLGVTFGRPTAVDSDFPTTDIVNQYDFFADFPRYFNLLAIVNAAFGLVFEHLVPGYIFADPENPNRVSTTVGNTTYVTLPTNLLPMLLPFRAVASLVGLGRLIDCLDPVLRVLVEMGYDRTADPSKVQQFEFSPPPDKVAEALAKIPGAIAQGLRILSGEEDLPAATLPTPIVSTPTPIVSTPVAAVESAALATDDAVPARTALEPARPAVSEVAELTADAGSAAAGDAVDAADAGSPPAESDAAEPEADAPADTTEPKAKPEAGPAEPADAAEPEAEPADTAESEAEPAKPAKPNAKPADTADADDDASSDAPKAPAPATAEPATADREGSGGTPAAA